MCSMQGTRDLFAIARLDLLQREHHEISAETEDTADDVLHT